MVDFAITLCVLCLHVCAFLGQSLWRRLGHSQLYCDHSFPSRRLWVGGLSSNLGNWVAQSLRGVESPAQSCLCLSSAWCSLSARSRGRTGDQSDCDRAWLFS